MARYRSDVGLVRVGCDGQIVDVKTHKTVCSSDKAKEWAAEHCVGKAREDILRSLYWTHARPTTALDRIAHRKNDVI